MDTRCKIASNIARNVAPCVRTLSIVTLSGRTSDWYPEGHGFDIYQGLSFSEQNFKLVT